MIVDCSGISFIDATGVKTLEEVRTFDCHSTNY